MNVVKRIDDIGRITIPRDWRNSLRWMGGDEIEMICNDDGTILLRKYVEDDARALKELSSKWENDSEIYQQFLNLIQMLEK